MLIRWIGLCSTAAFVLIGADVCYSQNAGQQLGAGIHNNFIHIPAPGRPVDAVLASYGLTFRTDYKWQSIEESSAGSLSIPKVYKELDDLVMSTVARGEKPLLALDYGNKFYDGGDRPTSPAAIAAYAKYAKFVVNHFKGRVGQYEIWNEWNNGHGSTQNPPAKTGPAAEYVALLRAAYTAIKSEDPNAVVVGGAVGGLDNAWIDAFIAAGGLTYVDAFSIHPYVQSRLHKAATAGAPIPGTPEDSIEWIDRLNSQISKASGKKIPIFVTEIGWPTNLGGDGSTDDVSAAYLQRFILLARARPWIGGVWIYELFDGGSDPHNGEHRFGILRQTGEQKPASVDLLAIKSLVQLNSPLKQTQGPDGEIVVSTEGGGGRAAAVWLPTNDFSTSRPSPAVEKLLQSGYRIAGKSGGKSVSGTPLVLVH